MFKTNKLWEIVVYWACLIMLVSCQHGINESQVIPTRTPSVVSVATLRSYLTPISVFEYPEQVTDGNLLFSIESVSTECSKAGNPIKIKLIFKNLTEDTIKLPSDFAIAANRRGDGGNLIPFITTTKGLDIFTPGDFQLVDIFTTPSSIYREIPSDQSDDFIIEFAFPLYLAEQASNKEAINLVTPVPSQYFIRLIFLEYPRGNGIWNGAIGSNKLELCILN